jgi:hypothetical protein
MFLFIRDCKKEGAIIKKSMRLTNMLSSGKNVLSKNKILETNIIPNKG